MNFVLNTDILATQCDSLNLSASREEIAHAHCIWLDITIDQFWGIETSIHKISLLDPNNDCEWDFTNSGIMEQRRTIRPWPDMAGRGTLLRANSRGLFTICRLLRRSSVAEGTRNKQGIGI